MSFFDFCFLWLGMIFVLFMWAITHDPPVWEDPLEFKPESFIEADVDVRGGDLKCNVLN